MTARAASEPGATHRSGSGSGAGSSSGFGPESGSGPGSGAPRDAAAAARVRIVVADDQDVVRAGFAALLATQPDFEVVGSAADGAEAVRLCAARRPDVVLMDVRMPGMDGIEATRRIVAARPPGTPPHGPAGGGGRAPGEAVAEEFGDGPAWSCSPPSTSTSTSTTRWPPAPAAPAQGHGRGAPVRGRARGRRR